MGYNEPGMIQIYHLTLKYPSGTVVFQDAHFSAPSSSFVVVTGGNRSGKSTLLKLLCGEETPTSGLVLVDGRRVAELDPEGRRGHLQDVGLVFPDMGLLWERTLAENLLLPLHLRAEFESVARKKVQILLEKAGLKGREGVRPADLSFGEQRAVVFLRALVAQPRILLADEPFQGLDASLTGTFLDLLAELPAKGSTVVLATQDPSGLARYAASHPELRMVWAKLEDARILPAEAPPC